MSERTHISQVAAVALIAAMTAQPALADEGKSLPETLQELEREADILSEQTRRAIEGMLPMLESVMERLPLLIDSIPAYEAPKILPNGDIIIRRKRDLPTVPDDRPGEKGGIKT